MLRNFIQFLLVCIVGLSLTSLAIAIEASSESNLGAMVFSERCVLCHGSKGMGEGPLPMSLRDYPSANLLSDMTKNTRQEVLETIQYGSGRTPFMPPWKDELSAETLSAVTDFILLLRSDSSQALKQLASVEEIKQKNISDGKRIFATRCVLCHGPKGLGDGRMRKVIKSPPPFNLTLSRLPKDDLKNIITNGGEAVWRSPQMPPWGDQLSSKEIDAVIEYIVTLRKSF